MALNAKATQTFVPIKEIRDGIIILKDGGLRLILMASSINLSLKSTEEQEAILLQFQNFLNSIDFSIQIVAESRKLDIRPYLLTLEERMKEQLEPLLKTQTKEYIEFIKAFTEKVAIMKKSFFVVVPYSGVSIAGSALPSGLFGAKKSAATVAEDATAKFEEQRSQLEQRAAVVTQGLSSIGVRTVALRTEEAVELFYKIFNPGDLSGAIKL